MSQLSFFTHIFIDVSVTHEPSHVFIGIAVSLYNFFPRELFLVQSNFIGGRIFQIAATAHAGTCTLRTDNAMSKYIF